MENRNTFRPVARHIDGWVSRAVIYHCPQCDASFRLLKHQEKFCHNCGVALDWTNLPTHLSQQMEKESSYEQALQEINARR